MECSKCGMCCTFQVSLTDDDIILLKSNIKDLSGIDLEKKQMKFKYYKDVFGNKKLNPSGYSMHYCYYFDTQNKLCTIYEFRPTDCKSYPGNNLCVRDTFVITNS